jgi:hypothetical protein
VYPIERDLHMAVFGSIWMLNSIIC